MENIKNKRKIKGGIGIDRSKLIIGIWLIVFLSMPDGAYALDILETGSSLILMTLGILACCGLIGAYARRNGELDKY